MHTRRKSTAKPRTSASSRVCPTEKSKSSTQKKRRRISRERLEDDAEDALLTDPNYNLSEHSVPGRESLRTSSRKSNPPSAVSSTPVQGRRTSLDLDQLDIYPTPSPSRKRSRVTRKESGESIQMSLLSRTEGTDWLQPRRSTDSVTPDLVRNIKVRHSSGSSQEAFENVCWVCHRPKQLVFCRSCPRAYHFRCLDVSKTGKTSEVSSQRGWQCSLCRKPPFTLTASEEEKWRPVTSTFTYENQLKKALVFMVDFMSIHKWSEPFREPADPDEHFDIEGIVRFPMDLRTLLKKVNDGLYKSTDAFLADFLWIIHNCFISEKKPDSQLLVKARSLEQMCLCEIELLKACPTCYLNRITAFSVLPSTAFVFPAISKCEPRIYRRPEMRKPTRGLGTELAEGLWFGRPCSVIHPIVWVLFEEGRHWPGKMMAELPNNRLLVSFFGIYTTRKTPTKYVTLHTSGAGVNQHKVGKRGTEVGLKRLVDSGELKDPETYARACEELERHIPLIINAFPKFRLPDAPAFPPLHYSQQAIRQYYGRFNQWISVGNDSSLPCTSEPGPAASPWPTGDKADVVQPSETRSPLLSSVSTPLTTATTAASSPPPPPLLPLPSSQRPLVQSSPSELSSSCPALSSVGVSRPPSLGDFSLPILVPLPDNLSSFGSPPHHRLEETHESTTGIVQSEGKKEADFESKYRIPVGPLTVDIVDTPDTLTTITTDSTPSTAPLVLEDNRRVVNLKADLISRFQEAREVFSSQFQSVLNNIFKSLEASINEASSASPSTGSAGASIIPPVASEPETQSRGQREISTRDEGTQTSDNVVVSAKFFAENKMKMALMRAEICRQSQELERLRLALDHSRCEMAGEHRYRLTELRAVWEAELLAVVNTVAKFCERETQKIVDVVKKKQWCKYCGNEALFLCCWNTSYCNMTCQQLHWPQHMQSCAHPAQQRLEQVGHQQQLQHEMQ